MTFVPLAACLILRQHQAPLEWCPAAALFAPESVMTLRDYGLYLCVFNVRALRSNWL